MKASVSAAIMRRMVQAPSDATPPRRARDGVRSRAFLLVFGVATLIRLIVFPVTENKHSDAPVRALITERMNADPAAAADPRTFCQFGPLPIEVMRPFMALDPDPRRGSRWPSLLAGLALFFPFWAYARRVTSDVRGAVEPAGLALAVSPLLIQVTTTAASEATYLLLFVAMLERLHVAVADRDRRAMLLAGVLASLAGVTRFDSWLAVPAAGAAALLFGRRDRRAVVDVGLFVALAAALPLAYMGWLASVGRSPIYFLRFINADHATVGREMVARYGPALARARQLGLWLAALTATLTPVLLVAAGASLRRFFRWSVATRVVVCAGLAPLGVYLLKGLVLGEFEPLPRFALVPGVVMAPLGAIVLTDLAAPKLRGLPRVLRPRALIVAGALATAGITSSLAFRSAGRVWAGAESLGPVTRLSADERDVAAYLREHRRPEEGVFVDTVEFEDITIAHAARVPMALVANLSRTRHPLPDLAAMRAKTDASWFAANAWSWGREPINGWPADAVNIGRWRIAHWPPPTPPTTLGRGRVP